MLLFDGGYVDFSGEKPRYCWYTKDHLGSVRVVSDADGNVFATYAYRPYGEEFAAMTPAAPVTTNSTSQNSQSAPVSHGEGHLNDNEPLYPTVTYSPAEGPDWQPFKFSGKESLTRVGLDLYDFGARMYSPSAMRWMTMDPLCEKFYDISPYVYCAGNPVNLVEPNGMQWYSYTDKDGNTKYTYWEGEMPEEEQAKYNNIKYVDYTFSDETNNIYYSLFGNRVPIKEENGSRLNYKLYKHLDKLFIRAYGGDDPDGVGSENFFEPEAVGREYIDFTYDGKNFKSIAGWFEVFDNEENSIGGIATTPNPKKPIISGRSSNSPGWRKNCGVGGPFAVRTLPAGYYLQVKRKGGSEHMIDVAYNKSEAGKFAAALAKLFPLK